jgi:GTP-binding protein
MALPAVVIVGRPNVGKSSLLNAVAGERISIVDARAGITRDRVSATVALDDYYFELIDTGGLGIVDDDHLETHVEDQIRYAVARADLILFVVDVEAGVTPLDQKVAEMLRKLDKAVLLVVNKADDVQREAQVSAFSALGFGEPLALSAVHGRGRSVLVEQIVERLGPQDDATLDDPVMKLAIVGKRNAGKSTLVNQLAGEARVIVSEIPGTTRDAVDVRFERNGREFVAIDTAGVRKKARMDDLDYYSYTRALRSIERADVVMLLIDSTVPVAEVDLKLIRAVLDQYKPVVLTINKWDLAEHEATVEQYGYYLSQVIPGLPYAPIAFMTATTGRNVGKAVDVALSLHEQAQTRVPTAKLNEALQKVLEERGPSAKRGTKQVKLYYVTQVSVGPPTIVCFCNDPAAVTDNYRRFMENRLRELLPFTEIPIRLWFRPRRGRDKP